MAGSIRGHRRRHFHLLGKIGAKDSQNPGETAAKVRALAVISSSLTTSYEVIHISYPFFILFIHCTTANSTIPSSDQTRKDVHARKRIPPGARLRPLPVISDSFVGSYDRICTVAPE